MATESTINSSATAPNVWSNSKTYVRCGSGIMLQASGPLETTYPRAEYPANRFLYIRASIGTNTSA